MLAESGDMVPVTAVTVTSTVFCHPENTENGFLSTDEDILFATLISCDMENLDRCNAMLFNSSSPAVAPVLVCFDS